MIGSPKESEAKLGLPDIAMLDRGLMVAVALAFLVLFLVPGRIFQIPFPYDGDFITYQPLNVVDLLWIGIGVALFARSGGISARAVLALAVILAVGAIGLVVNGEAGMEQLADLLLFNLRMAGGLAVGSLLFRSGFNGDAVSLMYLGGAATVALAAIPLALGWVSYDFYTGMGRFGSLGLAPNEAGIILAGAFNMLPWIMRKRRWVVLVAPLLFLGVLITGSRTALLLMMIGAAWWVPSVVGSIRGFRGIVVTVLIMVVWAAVAWWAWGFVEQIQTQGAVASIAARTAETGADESSTFRLRIYLDTITYLLEHPGALAVGVGGSNTAVEWVLVSVLPLGTYHTHDLALQALAAYGLIGPVACAVLLWPLLRRPARFPDLGSKAMRAFILSVVAGQVIQYGLVQVKFLLLFAMALGYVTAASATPVSGSAGGSGRTQPAAPPGSAPSTGWPSLPIA